MRMLTDLKDKGCVKVIEWGCEATILQYGDDTTHVAEELGYSWDFEDYLREVENEEVIEDEYNERIILL